MESEVQAQEQMQTNSISMMKKIYTDVMYFKDEILKDMRKLELQTKGHIDKKSSEFEKKLISIQGNFNKLSTKIDLVLNTMSESNAKVDKIEQLIKMINKIED